MATIITEPQAATPRQPNPYLHGNYAPIDFEATAFGLRTAGAVPKELSGRLLRIGPNPTQLPNAEQAHWFTGLGMVHGVRLSEGRAVWYRSRYVRAGTAARNLGLEVAPGPIGSTHDGAVNTTVLHMGGTTYACVEAGSFPVELSYELDSRSRSDLGGGLTRGFAAHAKTDPRTGEHIALAYQPGVPNVQYLVVGTDGVARLRAEIALPHMPLIHDVAITQTSVIVLDLPVTFKPSLVPGDFPYKWNHSRDARVGLLPRDGDITQLQWFEVPRCFVFHCLNAYDEANTVVLDVCRHPKMFASGESDISEGKPILARWIFDRTSGTMSETIVDDYGCEFPRLNGAFESRPHRYGYTATATKDGKLGPTLKHDFKTGTTLVHGYGPGRVAMEPVFVARAGATDEDDGWLMSYVYDVERDSSDIVILSALDFSAPPVATIQLPVRVPFGFHGDWMPDASA